MNTLSKNDKALFISYSITMFALYLVFLILDWNNSFTSFEASISIKYISIILCFIYTLILFIESLLKKKDLLIILFGLIAIIFTLISDWFLLIINKYYIVGLITFSIAQIATMIRIHFSNKNNIHLFISIAIRTIALIVAIIIPFILTKYDNIILYSFAGFYFMNLVMNFIDSSIKTIITRRLYLALLSLGLLLFIGCDIFVGLANIFQDNIFYNASWIFYLPCQYFITISLIRNY